MTLRDGMNFRNGTRWAVVAWVLGIVLTAVGTYAATSRGFEIRVAAIENRVSVQEVRSEVHTAELMRRLDRIERILTAIQGRSVREGSQ